jgi:hypothetical protein
MESSHLVLFELTLVLGGVLGWGMWELCSLRREQRKEEAARDAGALGSRRNPPGQDP